MHYAISNCHANEAAIVAVETLHAACALRIHIYTRGDGAERLIATLVWKTRDIWPSRARALDNFHRGRLRSSNFPRPTPRSQWPRYYHAESTSR